MRWDPQVVSLLNAQVTEGYLDIFFCGSISARNDSQSPCLGIISKSWKSARQPRNCLSSKEWPPLRGEGLSVVYQKFEKFCEDVCQADGGARAPEFSARKPQSALSGPRRTEVLGGFPRWRARKPAF
jgi:hypothetical protein